MPVLKKTEKMKKFPYIKAYKSKNRSEKRKFRIRA